MCSLLYKSFESCCGTAPNASKLFRSGDLSDPLAMTAPDYMSFPCGDKFVLRGFNHGCSDLGVPDHLPPVQYEESSPMVDLRKRKLFCDTELGGHLKPYRAAA